MLPEHISGPYPEEMHPAVAIKLDKDSLTSEIVTLLFICPFVMFGPVSTLEQQSSNPLIVPIMHITHRDSL